MDHPVLFELRHFSHRRAHHHRGIRTARDPAGEPGPLDRLQRGGGGEFRAAAAQDRFPRRIG